VSLLVAIGVNNDGYREILGICEGAKEDKAGWSGFLKHLKERGLKGIRLIISDACMGLAESAAEFFPDAAWQRCVVHWYRNVFSHVPSTKMRESAAMLKAIHAGEDIAAARQKAVQVTEKLRGLRLTKAAELVETAVEETLAYRPVNYFDLNRDGRSEGTLQKSVDGGCGSADPFSGLYRCV
jgi:putative transposase